MARHERLYHSEGDSKPEIDSGVQLPPHTPASFDQSQGTGLTPQSNLGSSSTAPDLGLDFSHFTETVAPDSNFSTYLASGDLYPQVDVSQEGLQIPDPFWGNDAFSFPNFVPSQFLDTDVSLYDLFHQPSFPRDSVSQAPVHGPLESHSTQNNSESEAEFRALETNPIPERPPKFPSVGDQLQNTGLETGPDAVRCPWAVSSATYKTILGEITQYQDALSNFSPPSRCALVRYLEGYFNGFQKHLPFLHPPTFDPGNIKIELLLSMAAMGAMYRYEYPTGHYLYGAARSVLDYHLQIHRRSLVGQLTRKPQDVFATKSCPGHSTGLLSNTNENDDSTSRTRGPDFSCSNLHTAQALIILMVMSSWGQKSLVQDSIATCSQLAFMIRDIGMHESDNTNDRDLRWLEWVAYEQRRRTLFAAYTIFSMHTIAFNVPPMILAREVSLNLPSCEAEWNATSSVPWERYRALSALHKRGFSATMDRLTNGESICEEGAISSFSNYVLIHGLVQKIYLEVQDATFPAREISTRPELQKSIEMALRSWQCSWEATWESTLDPCSPKGPLGFNATALLRLAYIRLNSRVAMCHEMISDDPGHIRKVLTQVRKIQLTRSPSLDRTVLQCIHALSIPVRVGIAYVAHTQTLHWGVQHSICHLECALFLTMWLQRILDAVRVDGVNSLRGDEQQLLAMTQNLVQETHLRETVDQEGDPVSNIHRLPASISRLWAEISSGTHAFDIVHRVGRSLSVLASVLESQHSGT